MCVLRPVVERHARGAGCTSSDDAAIHGGNDGGSRNGPIQARLPVRFPCDQLAQVLIPVRPGSLRRSRPECRQRRSWQINAIENRVPKQISIRLSSWTGPSSTRPSSHLIIAAAAAMARPWSCLRGQGRAAPSGDWPRKVSISAVNGGGRPLVQDRRRRLPDVSAYDFGWGLTEVCCAPASGR